MNREVHTYVELSGHNYFPGDNFSKSRERDSTAISMQGATFSWRLEHPIVDAQQDNHSGHSDGEGKDLNGTENLTVTEWKLCDVNLFIPAVSQTCVCTYISTSAVYAALW